VGDPRRGSHLQDGLRQRWFADHIESKAEPDDRAALKVNARRGEGLRRDADRRPRGRIIGFRREAVPRPKTNSRRSRATVWRRWASTCSTRHFLFDQLCQDATLPGKRPRLWPQHYPVDHQVRIASWRFRSTTKNSKQDAYWKRRGHASTPITKPTSKLTAVDPLLNLYDYHWPVAHRPAEPAAALSFVFDEGRPAAAARPTTASIWPRGTIIAGGQK